VNTKKYFSETTKKRNEDREAKREEKKSGSSDPAKSGVTRIIIEEDEEVLPTVYHAGGNLPKGLPEWFGQYDTDKDGQVSLYEWRIGKKSAELDADFEKMDRNGDGFLTAEEIVYYQARATQPARQTSQVTVISSSRPDEPARPDSPYSKKGNKKGGPGGGPGKKGRTPGG